MEGSGTRHQSQLSRPCTDALVSSTLEDHRIREALSRYDLICFGGLPLTGKTHLIQSYQHHHSNFSITKYNKQIMLKMLYGDRIADEGIFPILNRFETDALHHMMIRPNHQVLWEGWLSSRQERARLLKAAKNHAKCIIIVDEPDEVIFSRLNGEYLGMDLAEFRLYIRERRERFIWPSLSEGWTAIYYITSHDVNFLLESVHQQEY